MNRNLTIRAESLSFTFRDIYLLQRYIHLTFTNPRHVTRISPKLHVLNMKSSKYTWLTVLYPTAIKILWIENCLLLMCHYDGVWIGLWIFLTNVPINVKDVMYYVNSDSDLCAILHPNCLASWCTCYTIIRGSNRSSNLTFTKFLSTIKWYQNHSLKFLYTSPVIWLYWNSNSTW